MMNIKPPTYSTGDTLINKAYMILMNNLMSYGNTPNQAHCDALYALLRTMTEMSQGKCNGRYAFGLPTGMGKTQSIIAWIVALYKLGNDYTSVSISASKVEALCDIKRSLMSLGVPEEMIGLLHSYQYDPDMKGNIKEGYASLPSTGDDERQIMLVTHNRVRGSDIDESFHYYGEFKRDLMIYDESLIVSDSFGIDFKDFGGDVARLTDMHHDDEEYNGLINYLSKALGDIQTGFDSLDDTKVCVVELKDIDDERLSKYKRLLRKVKRVDTLHSLFEIAHLPLRLINNGSSGFVTYTMAVPPEIRNILVLDASYPIRELIHMDNSIHDAEEKLPYLQSLNTPLSQLKDFSNVTVKHMNAVGSRNSMTREFQQQHSDRKVLVDICDVVKSIPPNESVLIFTFKKRTKKEVDFKLTLEKTLGHIGVNSNQTIQFNGEVRQRINIITWGMETSLNDFNHCQHVVLLGVLHRAPIELSSSILGQSDDLKLPVANQDIYSIQKSELAHLIYQAASRGACRTVEDGYAKAMTLYLVLKDKNRVIRDMLDTVMPNLQWEIWEGNYSKLKEGAIVTLAKRINEFLMSLTISSISINQLKKEMGLLNYPLRTFTAAREYCLDNLNKNWVLDKRSLVIDF